MIKKSLKSFSFWALLLVSSLSLIACGSDDDDGGSSSSVVNNTYQYDETSIDGDGNPEEYHTKLTFENSSTCKVKVWGYSYIWYDGYRKENFSSTESCICYISGNEITLRNYPFYDSGNMVLKNKGKYLIDQSGNIYYKK